MSLVPSQISALLAFSEALPTSSLAEFLCAHMENLDGEKSVIIGVNSLLVNSKTRYRGLDLLKEVIHYCSPEVLNENLLHWSGFCVIHHVEDSDKEFKLSVLTKILEHSEGVDIFHKKFMTEHLNSTLKACLVSHCNEEKISGLKCLAQCMKRYPTWFGNHKQKIEKYLVECLDSSCEKVAEVAALCFLYFLQTGGAGNNGINYMNNFSSEFKKMCATIQNLFDSFFNDIPEVKTALEIESEIIKFQRTLNVSSDSDMEGIFHRLVNCLIFLKSMLIKNFPVEKRIVIKHVVDIIYRGLSVHVCYTEAQILKNTTHIIFLKKIQMHLLSILRVLVKGYRLYVLPFSVIFQNCLLNCLRRIHTCNCFTFDLTYKICTYKALISWFSSNQIINEAVFLEKIVPLLLKDISLTRKTVVLNIKDAPGNRKNSTVQSDKSANKGHLVENIVDGTCIHALEILQCLLLTCDSIDQNLLKEILLVILTNLGNVQLGNTRIPFKNPACLAKLYKVLIVLFKKGVRILPSLHLTIDLLNMGFNSQNEKISQTCKEGLQILEKISHPVCPSLYLGESSSFVPSLPHNNVFDKVYEASRSEEKPKIKIISNIVIPSTMSEYQKDEEMSVEIIDVEEIDTIRSKEIESSQATKDENEDVEMLSVSEESFRVVNNSKKKSVSFGDVKPVENGKDNGGMKSEIIINSDLEDMFQSFQDEVQE